MKRQWQQQRQRSSPFWIAVLAWLGRSLGPRPMYLILYPVVAYFYLTAAGARNASRDYLSRVLARPVTRRDVFKHLYTFARVSADRLFLLSGEVDRYRIEIKGEDDFDRAMAGGRGCLLLVAHLGSFEAMRVLGVRGRALPLRILLDRRHNPVVGDVLDKLDPQLAAGIIDAGQSAASLALQLDACLKAGELVGIMADRAGQSESVVRTEFLGEQASFPAGPWMMALVLGVPVVLCFGLYQGDNRYKLHFELMTEGLAASRRERREVLAQSVAHYAERLEHHVRAAPYNWFNFYDFWADESTTDS